MKILIIDFYEWMEYLALAARRSGHEACTIHVWDEVKLLRLVSEPHLFRQFDGVVIDWCEVKNKNILERLIQALRDHSISLLFYTNVEWMAPRGVELLYKRNIVEDFPLILAALERRPT